MTNATVDDLVDDYLDRLEAELAHVPAARRRELVREISDHIAEARRTLPGESEAEIRTLFDRLGDPADIAAEAEERLASAPRERPAGLREVSALVLLLVGALIVPPVGWLAGVVLLWSSRLWMTRDKLIGTFVVPGGLAPALLFALAGGWSDSEVCVNNGVQCSGGGSSAMDVVGPIVLVILVLAPLATTLYLALRLRAARRPDA